MTVPRKEIFIKDESNFYHCITRCVRRAFLCGKDLFSGRTYDHRRKWIEERLSFLTEIFSIELASYSVMPNHLHTVIRNRPDVSGVWSDEEVAIRWRKLFPLRRDKDGAPCIPSPDEILALTSSPKLIEIYRERLSSLSWFHRCLNENIARRANAEDECTGRFWEGRFKSIRLDSDAAVISCCVYVDLNPIRAGLAKTPEESEFTSIYKRIKESTHAQLTKGTIELSFNTKPKLLSVFEYSGGLLTNEEYFSLVDQTGRMVKEKKAHISSHLGSILDRLKMKRKYWLEVVTTQEKLFSRIIGSVSDLRDAAKKMGKLWIHGLRPASLVFF